MNYTNIFFCDYEKRKSRLALAFYLNDDDSKPVARTKIVNICDRIPYLYIYFKRNNFLKVRCHGILHFLNNMSDLRTFYILKQTGNPRDTTNRQAYCRFHCKFSEHQACLTLNVNICMHLTITLHWFRFNIHPLSKAIVVYPRQKYKYYLCRSFNIN